MFVAQDGSCSDGGSGTPLSDRASLIGLDLQNQDSPEQDQDSQEAQSGGSNKEIKDGEKVVSSSSQSGLVTEDQLTEKLSLCLILVSCSH